MTSSGPQDEPRISVAPAGVGDAKSRKAGYLALVASALITATAFAGIADLASNTRHNAGPPSKDTQQFEREPSGTIDPGLVPGNASPERTRITVSGAASTDEMPTSSKRSKSKSTSADRTTGETPWAGTSATTSWTTSWTVPPSSDPTSSDPTSSDPTTSDPTSSEPPTSSSPPPSSSSPPPSSPPPSSSTEPSPGEESTPSEDSEDPDAGGDANADSESTP